MKKVLISAAISAALWGNPVSAQIVEGEVKGADGNVLSKVVLKVKGHGIQTTTDENGMFKLDLEPGRYVLDVKGGSDAHFHQEIVVSEAKSGQKLTITLQDEPGHKLIIRANPLDHTALNMATPTILMSGEELMLKRSSTLGEILQFEPGLSMSSFGPAVARPVIRGLGGSRVQIANNQMIVQDASTTSADHDVGVEPLLAEQIEVVKGPATMLYGSGAIGGIVNVTDKKINADQLDGVSGGIEMRLGDGATGEQSMVFALDAGNGDWNFHLDGFDSQTDDLEIPGSAESERLHELHEEEEEHEGEEHEEHEEEGVLENSSVENKGGSIGLTSIGEWGHFGAAVSFTDKFYGVPGHAHHEEELEGEGEEAHEEHHEAGVFIDMEQTRYDLQAQFNLSDKFDHWFVGYSRTDYEHMELEGDEIGTHFDNQAWEFKSYVKHNQWNGWRGVWGTQVTKRTFIALGEEAFVPPSQTKNNAIFLLEEKEYGDFKWELGLRWEDQKIEADGYADLDTHGVSFSSGLIYSLEKHNKIAFNFSRAVRFASVEELYSDGPHIATRSFEIGNRDLDKETSNNFDVSYRFEVEKLRGEVNLYWNKFNDYIYGEVVASDNACVSTEAAEEAEHDELQLVCYQQQDADFKGLEFQLDYELGSVSGHDFTLGFVADYIKAELDDGGDVPRIPPMKYGLVLNHEMNGFSSQLSWMSFDDQDKIGAGELETDGFDMLDLELVYNTSFGEDDLVVFLKGKNLLDEEARDHTSFLKDLAPRAGKNFVLGARYTF
ncbi:MAG: TonB-dependent receptor [Kangiellaceae bacterium]|nr:TonB-dependent receptor [Kangiellaceae bacterium]MCW9000970.1 TonB-dependent receptor [Kangiellaceae bacterium]